MKTAYPDVHVSETAWVGTDFDSVLDNNGTLDHLYTQVKCLVQDPQDARVQSRD